MDGSNVDFAPHMEGSYADFTLHMEWRHSFRDQIIAKVAILANKKKKLNHLYPKSLYDLCDNFENENILRESNLNYQIQNVTVI